MCRPVTHTLVRRLSVPLLSLLLLLLYFIHTYICVYVYFKGGRKKIDSSKHRISAVKDSEFIIKC